MKSALSVLLGIICLSGCVTQSVGGSAALTGATGAALGAGAGALSAYSIQNGLVGESAAVGAGVGLAAGAVLGAAAKTIGDQMTISANQSAIDDNKTQITETDRQIQMIRSDLDNEASQVQTSPALVEEKHYIGPRLGNYYRP